MSLQVEKLEKNMAKLTIEVDAAEVDKAIDKAYHKSKSKMNVPGFRKGKVPRQIIEKMYGEGVFYEDAANEMIPAAYEKAAMESDLDIVSQPEISVIQIEKNKPFIFTALVALKPDVELGTYKGIEVEKANLEVSEEEITAELNKIREQNSRLIPVEDRAVEMNDATTIDFEGFVDGVAFEGGKGTDYSLTIGSHSFIDTFEDQLVGAKIGEEVEVNVTFPEEYHVDELKGKPALFKVTVKEIKVKELPELDDEFASEVSEFETLEEYKSDLIKKLQSKKEDEAKVKKEDFLVDKIIEEAKMDIPEQMIDAQVKQMANDFVSRLQSQGIAPEQYFQITGTNPNQFLEQLRPEAVKRIESRLVLEAIVSAENIEVTEEEFNKEIEKMAAAYQMDLAKLKELISGPEEKQIKLDISVQKAMDFVLEQAKEA